jgi:hypothetical protein
VQAPVPLRLARQRGGKAAGKEWSPTTSSGRR